jgi:hypothetical protein
MNELIDLLKSFSSSFNLTKTGVTVFDPVNVDKAALTALCHPLGLTFREMKPTILPDGSVKQYYSAKENCMKDEMHMLIVGKPRVVSDAQMADHLNAILAS